MQKYVYPSLHISQQHKEQNSLPKNTYPTQTLLIICLKEPIIEYRYMFSTNREIVSQPEIISKWNVTVNNSFSITMKY